MRAPRLFYIPVLAATLCLLAFFFFGFPVGVHAATLSFSPSSGSYAAGDPLSVGVFVSSGGVAINAGSGVVSFPKDKLEVTSISKNQSIVSLWVQEPSFSNAAGTVNFEGIVLNPGFSGSSGRLITINFRVKALGSAPLSFSGGAALANDGEGTDILTSMGTAQFTLASREEIPLPAEEGIPLPLVSPGAPPAPRITSPTHPDSGAWYNDTTAKFLWDADADVTGVRLLLDRGTDTTPSVPYTGTLTERTVEGLEDGISYFHAQLRTSVGWGGVGHFRLQVDTEKPSRFDMTAVLREDATDPRARFVLEAEDELSGIDRFEVQIDNGEHIVFKDTTNNVFIAPAVTPGKHVALVKAYDKAGNYRSEALEFSVDALNAPRLDEWTESIVEREEFALKGTTYPDSTVTIMVRRPGAEPAPVEVKSNMEGRFVFATRDLEPGEYTFSLSVTDARGAQSGPGEVYESHIAEQRLVRFSTTALMTLSVIVPLFALVILLLILAHILWKVMGGLKKRIRIEVAEARAVVHKAFALLRDDMMEDALTLEKASAKRKLTKEEAKILKRLRKNIDEAEEVISKEITDIGKEVG